jgi:glycosyltransferase involved in cell wall biosynthesis
VFEAYERRVTRKTHPSLGEGFDFAECKELKICFVADGRSPIALNWISHFIQSQHEIHVISSYPCAADLFAGATVYEEPVILAGYSGASRNTENEPGTGRSPAWSVVASLRHATRARLAEAALHSLVPLAVHRTAQRLGVLISRISPDIVHAMRIPFEGILAAMGTPSDVPLVVSVWGNDFTLWASRNPIISLQTRQTLQRADALHCDCRRDLDLAVRAWGFDSSKPAVVLPGAGGVQASLFHPGKPAPSLRCELNIPDNAPVVFNPRGFRGYVRNDVFFRAIPGVLKEYPAAVFVCTAMQGNPTAKNWIRRLAIRKSVRLLPAVSRERMAELFRLASVAVSPSLHDGTPNTLLEAMACGCFPVAGDIESVREWITDGANGLLCDPTDPSSLAGAMIRALGDQAMRDSARKHNLELIAERADYARVMPQAEKFYVQINDRKTQLLRI